MNHYTPADFNKAVGSISEMISSEIDSLYELNLKKGLYRCVKCSDFLSKIFQTTGNSNQFLAKVLTEKPFQQEADRYGSFHLSAEFAGKIFGKYIELDKAGESIHMLFIYYKATAVKAYAFFYRAEEDAEFAWKKQAPYTEADAFRSSYLYSMVVNLDQDECYDIYIAEIVRQAPGPLQMKLSFAEWRKSLSSCILEKHLETFLSNTEPALLRRNLLLFNRHSYTVQMYLLDGRIHWTQHIFLRIQDEKGGNLRFICTVQDIDDVYALVAQGGRLTPAGGRCATGGGRDSGNFPGAAAQGQPGGSDAAAQVKAAPAPFSDLILAHVEAEMQENYMHKLALKDFAGKYYLNTAYLGQLFIHKYGMSFHAYLTGIRMEKAAVLLTNTSYSISRIAEMCGIPNSTYFHRQFRKHFGCTPMEYRSERRA